jgi:hypothetical protein
MERHGLEPSFSPSGASSARPSSWRPIDGQPLNRNFNLTHQNPVLLGMGLPVEAVQVTSSSKLCVPVAKNGFFPPG